MLKVNNRNPKTRRKICSKLTIKFEHLTYFTPCFSVSIVDFEKVNAGWVYSDHGIYISMFRSFWLFFIYRNYWQNEKLFFLLFGEMHVSLVLLKLTVFITLLENVQFKYLNSSQKLHAQIYNKTFPCRSTTRKFEGQREFTQI